MKELYITFSTDKPIMLPMSYHHAIQSMLYQMLDCSVHEKGYGYRNYKLFTFSALRGGKPDRETKTLTFKKYLYLDVRSVDDKICDSLLESLSASKVCRLLRYELKIEKVIAKEGFEINKSQIKIECLSPISIHTTNEDKEVHYYSPDEDEFSEKINANFARKYNIFANETSLSDISIKGIENQKYVTHYKQFYIIGYRGIYELSGNPRYLTFLYYCGLGARNSDGFGMFRVINDKVI